MKLLREYVRRLLTEDIEKAEIEDAIQDASFNSNNSSSHRWSRGQPYIDYYFDDAAGDWKFQAAFPDGTNDADKWPRLPENGWSDENIKTFLTQVKEVSHQLSLPLEMSVNEK